jgi:serine/threonine-protein kinase
MQPVDSDSLRERLEMGRLKAAEACSMALGVLRELATAHDAERMHGQLTASKVLLSRQALTPEGVKLAEFAATTPGSASKAGLGAEGRSLAEAYYLAPEQAKSARDVDARADLYAVGVMLYEAVTGQVPFDASTVNELMYKIVLEDSPSVARAAPELDPQLAAIIDKARAKDPAQRFQTGHEFEQALRKWVSQTKLDLNASAAPEPPQSMVAPIDAKGAGSKRWLIAAVIAVVLVVLVLALK